MFCGGKAKCQSAPTAPNIIIPPLLTWRYSDDIILSQEVSGKQYHRLPVYLWSHLIKIRFCCVYIATLRGLILGFRPANGRRRYKVTPSPIGWAQTLNQPGLQITKTWRCFITHALRPSPLVNPLWHSDTPYGVMLVCEHFQVTVYWLTEPSS